MDKNQLEKLVACEAKALKALGGDNGLLRLVEEFTFHWQLRDACDNGLQMDWGNPQPNTVYLEEDYLETNSKSTETININKFGSLGSVGKVSSWPRPGVNIAYHYGDPKITISRRWIPYRLGQCNVAPATLQTQGWHTLRTFAACGAKACRRLFSEIKNT